MKLLQELTALREAGRTFTIGEPKNKRSLADVDNKAAAKKKAGGRPEFTSASDEDKALAKRIIANIDKGLKNRNDDEMHVGAWTDEEVNELAAKWKKTLAKGDVEGWLHDYNTDGGSNPDAHTSLMRGMMIAALGDRDDTTYEDWAEKLGVSGR